MASTTALSRSNYTDGARRTVETLICRDANCVGAVEIRGPGADAVRELADVIEQWHAGRHAATED